MSNLLFIELEAAELVEGQPFDGLIAGTFTDMLGRKVKFEDGDLETYVKNTTEAIKATETESGEIVGLPIDAKGHEEGDGAGWIVGVDLEDGVVRFTPKWTQIGVDLIEKGIRRFFSATIDLARQVIMGGTLTNWPATRDVESGNTLLRPIEMAQLQQPMFQLEEPETSKDEEIQRVRGAWYETELVRDAVNTYVAEVFEDYIIVDDGARTFKVEYQYDAESGVVTFAAPDTWIEVKRTWVEMIREFIAGVFLREAPIEGNADENEVANKPSETEETNMPVKLEDLSPEDRVILVSELATEMGAEAPDVGNPMVKLIEDRAAVLVAEQTAAAAKESEIAQLAASLTGGTEEAPAGLPVGEDELKELLSGLTAEQRNSLGAMLARIQSEGLVEFNEDGHSKKLAGKAPLPVEMAPIFVTHLADGGTKAEFFAINAEELGAMGDYDLSDYETEKEE